MAERIFVDWTRPLLDGAVRSMVQRWAETTILDLTNVVCLVPGRRGGRLLLSTLASQCSTARLELLPPHIITPGSIIDTLLQVDHPLASSTEQLFAWMRAIGSCSPRLLKQLVATPPGDGPIDCEPLARLFHHVAIEIAGGDKRFADAARLAESRGLDGEAARFRALEELEQGYHDVLTEAGLTDPHRAAALLLRDGALRSDLHPVLVGVTELNTLHRRILGRFGDRVVSYVHAPDGEADRFDDLGCVCPEQWTDARLDLNEAYLHLVNQPVDQANRAIRLLFDVAPRFAADDVTIALGDETLQVTLETRASWASVTIHSAGGTSLADSAPLLLLERLTEWLEEPRFVHLTNLLRHPDIEFALKNTLGDDEDAQRGTARWIGLLEAYFSEHLHHDITRTWLGDEAEQVQLRAIHDAVATLTRPLRGEPQPLARWCDKVLELLADVFGSLSSQSTARSRTVAACLELRDVLASLIGVDRRLSPPLLATEAIRLIIAQASHRAVPAGHHDHQVEAVGWLELHLDPSPVAIITGFNDGSIPSTVIGHPFLPDSMRSALGLSCNATRAARDAYLLTAAAKSHDELHLISGRRGETDEPILPSRFLFATDDETVLARVKALVGDEAEAEPQSLPFGLPHSADVSRFTIPELPAQLPTRDAMRITEFRTYLACPYRYALQRLLYLREVEARTEELSALAFGNLAHRVLESFGNSDLATSTDHTKIARYLEQEADRQARADHGTSLLPAVHVQLAHLKQRLRDFTQWQANENKLGWEIRHCELAFTGEVELDMPEDKDGMPLRGTVDRIDYHPATNRWRIIDYKTGAKGESPYETHHKKGQHRIPTEPEGRWRDLQLPLYHYLLTQSHHIPNCASIELGYVVLPNQAGGVRFREAGWSDELLAEAVQVARDVVTAIRRCEFAINLDFRGYETLPRICQTSVFGGGRELEAVT